MKLCDWLKLTSPETRNERPQSWHLPRIVNIDDIILPLYVLQRFSTLALGFTRGSFCVPVGKHGSSLGNPMLSRLFCSARDCSYSLAPWDQDKKVVCSSINTPHFARTVECGSAFVREAEFTLHGSSLEMPVAMLD